MADRHEWSEQAVRAAHDQRDREPGHGLTDAEMRRVLDAALAVDFAAIVAGRPHPVRTAECEASVFGVHYCRECGREALDAHRPECRTPDRGPTGSEGGE